MIGGLGCVSCTGKYDNISFNLKTPYLHVCVYVFAVLQCSFLNARIKGKLFGTQRH